MAYFSNGTEGCMYEAQWCANCYHARNMYPYQEDETAEQIPCPVWEVHFLHAYGAKAELRSVLDSLIPMEGVHAAKCKMFVPKTSVPPTQRELLDESLHRDAERSG